MTGWSRPSKNTMCPLKCTLTGSRPRVLRRAAARAVFFALQHVRGTIAVISFVFAWRSPGAALDAWVPQ
jgi:hypothetical protein